MPKKLISSLLIVSLLNLVGCYSSQTITSAELQQIEKEDSPDEILVKTNDSREFIFSEANFNISNDTLYGKAKTIKDIENPIEGSIPFAEMDYIQFKAADGNYKLVSVEEYRQFEVTYEKPDKIIVTDINSTRYKFYKDDFQLVNDTLFGKGKLLIAKEQFLDVKIATSEIVSIESEQLNVVNTILVIGIPIAIGILAFYAYVFSKAGSKGSF